ncbi:MAG: DUF1553 domain-containing protein [Opitutus sp.]|nr:DUF1553 domain-containing protein [Opitutus sp.]
MACAAISRAPACIAPGGSATAKPAASRGSTSASLAVSWWSRRERCAESPMRSSARIATGMAPCCTNPNAAASTSASFTTRGGGSGGAGAMVGIAGLRRAVASKSLSRTTHPFRKRPTHATAPPRSGRRQRCDGRQTTAGSKQMNRSGATAHMKANGASEIPPGQNHPAVDQPPPGRLSSFTYALISSQDRSTLPPPFPTAPRRTVSFFWMNKLDSRNTVGLASRREGIAILGSLFFWLAVGHAAPAGEKSSGALPPDVLSLLEAHCVKCHGGEKTKVGLDLTTRDALLRGGESGAAVVPGRPETSLLYRMVTHEEEPGMPHKEDKLPAEAIQQIAEWIRAGVPYSRLLKKTEPAPASAKTEFAITDADRAHWAFRPVKRIAPPAVRNTSWAKTPLDPFILAALESKGLKPSAPAGRETLIRRVTLDLTGLPPTPAEIDAFLADASPNAYETLIDRLLASPHYGERWGRHWLDLARFAESDGFEHDAVRPHAWRYRDYVVRAFNADKPYDRFIREQLAGDELYPAEPDALIATAFNLLGPDMVDSADQIQRRRNTLNDMTDTTALAFLGLTVGCARCHDHKFEPIAQRDYYRLQAFFAPAKFRGDLAVPTAAERGIYEAAMALYNEQTKALQAKITALEEPYRKTIYARKLAKLSPEAQAAHQVPKEQRTTEQENLVLETNYLVEIAAKELLAAMKNPDRDRHRDLLEELKPFPKPPPLPATLALQNGGPAKTHVLFRGDYNQPGDEVTAGFPLVLIGTDAARASPSSLPPTGRTPLANWIASPEHPLTARVMVNRIWQHHFGRSLAPTPSDFGTHGQKPTHPELLDWLAAEFVASGWSVKQMHRLILRSATYRQGSSAAGNSNQHSVISNQSSPGSPANPLGKPSPTDYSSSLITDNSGAAPITDYFAAAKIDPDNRLYWRMNRLRLEGEVVRDSLLAVSGELNPAIGGPGVFPPIPKEIFAGSKGWTTNASPHDYSRRSLYIFARRNLRFPFLEVFDAPDNNFSCPSRERSTTAPQSLTLLNADEVLRAADRTAQRLQTEADSPTARITLAYRLIVGRTPTANERRLSENFLAHSPLSELCRALFNLNAFVYAD